MGVGIDDCGGGGGGGCEFGYLTLSGRGYDQGGGVVASWNRVWLHSILIMG